MCGKEGEVIAGLDKWDVVRIRGEGKIIEVTMMGRVKAKAEFSRGALHLHFGWGERGDGRETRCLVCKIGDGG